MGKVALIGAEDIAFDDGSQSSFTRLDRTKSDGTVVTMTKIRPSHLVIARSVIGDYAVGAHPTVEQAMIAALNFSPTSGYYSYRSVSKKLSDHPSAADFGNLSEAAGSAAANKIAVDAAIAYAQANKLGVVEMPPGTFELDPVRISNSNEDEAVILRGNNHKTVIVPNSTVLPTFDVSGGCAVQNMTIAAADRSSTAHGILIGNGVLPYGWTKKAHFKDLYFENLKGYGLKIDYSGEDSAFDRIYFDSCGSGSSYPVLNIAGSSPSDFVQRIDFSKVTIVSPYGLSLKISGTAVSADTDFDNTQMITIKDLRIFGGVSEAEGAYSQYEPVENGMINILMGSDITFENLVTTTCRTGYWHMKLGSHAEAPPANRIRVKGWRLGGVADASNGKTNGGSGIYMDKAEDCSFEDVHFNIDSAEEAYYVTTNTKRCRIVNPLGDYDTSQIEGTGVSADVGAGDTHDKQRLIGGHVPMNLPLTFGTTNHGIRVRDFNRYISYPNLDEEELLELFSTKGIFLNGVPSPSYTSIARSSTMTGLGADGKWFYQITGTGGNIEALELYDSSLENALFIFINATINPLGISTSPTFKHGLGNIVCPGGVDYALDYNNCCWVAWIGATDRFMIISNT